MSNPEKPIRIRKASIRVSRFYATPDGHWISDGGWLARDVVNPDQVHKWCGTPKYEIPQAGVDRYLTQDDGQPLHVFETSRMVGIGLVIDCTIFADTASRMYAIDNRILASFPGRSWIGHEKTQSITSTDGRVVIMAVRM